MTKMLYALMIILCLFSSVSTFVPFQEIKRVEETVTPVALQQINFDSEYVSPPQGRSPAQSSETQPEEMIFEPGITVSVKPLEKVFTQDK